MHDAGTLETYVPVDISEEITRRVADELVAEYDGLRVHGVVCDYETHLERVPREEGALIAFLGGTIGNFRPGPRRSFLARIATLMYPGDRFLLGTDLVKDTAVLEAAYNDSRRGHGRVQQERAQRPQPRARRQLRPRQLRARRLLRPRERVDRHPPALARRAVHRPAQSSTCAPTSPATRRCAPRSRRKFTRERLEASYADAGLELVEWWTDPDELYALSLAQPAGS